MIERHGYQAPIHKEPNEFKGWLPMTRRGCLVLPLVVALCLLQKRFQLSFDQKENSAQKFLLIADTHTGTRDVSLNQANKDAAATLKSVFTFLKQIKLSFDRVIDMGDMIVDSPDENKSIANLQANLLPYRDIATPQTHLVGNHEEWNMPREKLSKTFRDLSLDDKFHGVAAFPDFQIVWLDLTAGKWMNGSLPEERIEWLRQVIYKDTPTYIFSHEGIVQQDLSNNVYFKNNPAFSMLTNSQEVVKALKGLPVEAIFSGHIHQAAHRTVNNTHMISLPSFSERIPPNIFNPGAISILEIQHPHFSLRSFSGTNCIYSINV